MKRATFCFLIVLSFGMVFGSKVFSPEDNNDQRLRVLILSGRNNHDWKSTTPYLKRMMEGSGLFSADITNRPDTLKSDDLSRYAVIVSNWNSWPDNDLRWPESTEEALLNFIKKGGGWVTFHASTSAFYQWPDFQKVSTGSWVMDTTWHGPSEPVRVDIENKIHPVTRGMTGFYIHDELWVNAGTNEKYTLLGSASNEDIKEKGIPAQPAVMVSQYGAGRIFHTILGHDVRTMRNTGFQTLMLRGTEWAATGKVTQDLPQELQAAKKKASSFRWHRTDTTFALMNGSDVVWQYNFNGKHGKPFFHPVFAGRNNLTCVSPDDHPWHLGQWFSWKYINGVNYWEYQGNSFQSEGITEIKDIQITPRPDFSAEINLEISYHPADGKEVLTELRSILVSFPQTGGNIRMDYAFHFKAVEDGVELDRTPIEGEPGGQSWGGYAGLSIRFNQDFMNARFISDSEDHENINGSAGNWLYMGFTGLDGKQVGSQIMIAPETRRDGAAWYSVNTPELPFYYFSPAYLYYKPLVLEKGEELHLKYRICHYGDEVSEEVLGNQYQKFL